ncbi:cation channel sperm-associated protein subunit delta-like [Orbicella faveolata]|uniref:cation channel sperm-associated protein subunit delta-like n=1 Tax=Orbicella faveolata TaxID=48498 RepID=UPI0009E20086|nr:cation channel sperm-associated protein subunit delta-like [Orbicella faveolata]
MSALRHPSTLLSFVLILLNLHPVWGICPKHEVLLHNLKSRYFLDKGEKLEAWAKLIPEPWGDNRMIGSLSNTEHLTFNLTSSEISAERQAIGVISRNVVSIARQWPICFGICNSGIWFNSSGEVYLYRIGTPQTVSIGEKDKQRRNQGYNYSRDVVFRIEAFSEDQSCITLKAETNVTIGCPLRRHIIPRGKPTSCAGFRNYSYLVQRYDGETFVKEVDVNYIMWEQHGRAGYKYSATMKEAGCISEAQSWEKMIRGSTQEETMESAWSKENYQSCFQQNSPLSVANLDQPYEILNSSEASSHIVWSDVGTFVFTLKVIDPDFSFCNLTMEFGVQVYGAGSAMEEIPTFVVLGSSCLATVILLFSGYYTAVLCSN